MPTLPTFTRDGDNTKAKLAWLKARYHSKADFRHKLQNWDGHVNRCDVAIFYTGVLSAGIVSLLSVVQTILVYSSVHNEDINKALSYTQTSLSLAAVFVASACKLIREAYDIPRTQTRTLFNDKFFQENDPKTIWPTPAILVKSLAKQITTIPSAEGVELEEKLEWLEQHFESRMQFEATLNDWDVAVQQYGFATHATAIVGAMLITLLSGIQSGIYTGTDAVALNNNNVTTAVSRDKTIDFIVRDALIGTQIGINAIVLALGSVVFVMLKYTPSQRLEDAKKHFNTRFFQDYNDDSSEGKLDKSKKGYIRHPVASDGDCGFTAFGIDRKAAVDLLTNNTNSVRELLAPAVKELLLTEACIKYLIDNKLLNATTTVEEAQTRFDDLAVINGCIQYDVRDRNRDSGWAHPAILRALAHIRQISIYIWRLDTTDQHLLPHRLQDNYDYFCYQPDGATQRLDLLYVNGNHFERLDLVGFGEGNFLIDPSELIYPIEIQKDQKNKIKWKQEPPTPAVISNSPIQP